MSAGNERKREESKERIRAAFEAAGVECPDLSAYEGNRSSLTFVCATADCSNLVFRRWQHLQQSGRTFTCKACFATNSQKLNAAFHRSDVLAKIASFEAKHSCKIDATGYTKNTSKVTIEGSCGHTFVSSYKDLLLKDDGRCGPCARPKGETSHFWKPHLTAADRAAFKDRGPAFVTWSRRVLRAADHTCVITGQRGGNMAAHHLWGWAEYPDKRFELTNGVCVRTDLHDLFHTKEYYGKEGFTPDDFATFIDRIRTEQPELIRVA